MPDVTYSTGSAAPKALRIYSTETAGRYYVEIADISANSLTTDFDITFGGVYTATVSAMSYVYNSLYNKTATEDVQNVLKALVAYSNAVEGSN